MTLTFCVRPAAARKTLFVSVTFITSEPYAVIYARSKTRFGDILLV